MQLQINPSHRQLRAKQLIEPMSIRRISMFYIIS